MFDHWHMEMKVRESLDPLSSRETELLRVLAEEREERRLPGLKRRLAAAFVGLGLRLDPEVARATPRLVAMEAAHVRD